MTRDSRRLVSFELLLTLGDRLLAVCNGSYEVVLFRVAFSLAFLVPFECLSWCQVADPELGGCCFLMYIWSKVSCVVNFGSPKQMNKGRVLQLCFTR